MREEKYRLLSPPERRTPKWRVITAAMKISDWLLLALGFLLIAIAYDALTPAPGGSIVNYLMLAISAVFTARFTFGPVVWLLKKLVGTKSKDSQDI